jgi:Asp-tRNA(Asn)/Glu-tRNA(Gln) amidotransferase A subunit family amidase
VDADLCFAPATVLGERIRRRDVSPVEIVTALLDRIGRYNGTLFSYITVCADAAVAAAREAVREISARRRRGPLHGLPISHKDIVFTRGVRTTCHSRTMLDLVPDADATVMRRIGAAYERSTEWHTRRPAWEVRAWARLPRSGSGPKPPPTALR